MNLATKDTVAHSGIQPWSQGALFPGVIKRVETYTTPLEWLPYALQFKRITEETKSRYRVYAANFYAAIEQRLVKTQWLATYGADERLCDTYEEAEQFIRARKKFDGEPKPYGRQADGIYQGELQSPVPAKRYFNIYSARCRRHLATVIAESQAAADEIAASFADIYGGGCVAVEVRSAEVVS
jgi:hypothetical protein